MAEARIGPDGVAREWEIEFFEDEQGRKPVLAWITGELSATKRRALGTAMRRVLQVQGPLVQRNHWGDKVAEGIFEFRLRMNGKGVINLEAEIYGITEDEARKRFRLDPSEDILLRVFCTTRKGKVILLLHGYDKGQDVSKKRQQSEIDEAKRRLEIVKQREAKERKAGRRHGKT